MCESHPHGPPHDHGVRHLDLRVGPDHSREFRVVLTGKGGVGKTSLTALLARLLAREHHAVLAIDADPQMNLPYALGLEREAARDLVPLGRNDDYVEEKIGVRPGSGYGLFLKLNPDVSDVVDRFGVRGPDGVNLLVMGTTVQPAAGCLCPENTLLAAVADLVALRPGEAILLDTQAGVEHFGRALAKGFRHCVVLTDPTFNGVQVGLYSARLADQLGIPFVHLVINRVRSQADLDRALGYLQEDGDFPFSTRHVLPFDAAMLETEPAVDALLDQPDSPLLQSVLGLRDALTAGEEAWVRCVS